MNLLFQNREKGSGRIYKGFVRGSIVQDVKDLKPGDKIILVDVTSENFVEIKDQGPDAIEPERKFYGSWVNFPADGEPWTESNIFCRWDFSVKLASIHRAVKVPIHDLNEVNGYTAQEVSNIMQTFNGESKKMEEITNNLDYYREHATWILADANSRIQWAAKR